MKFAILLLFCCCAVALAKPDGSKEVAKPPKHSSKEVKHSGSGSSESKESSDESSDKSSNESGKKDDGGSVIGIPGIVLPNPSVQVVESLLDRGVDIVASLLGLHNIHGLVDLIHLIESNPIGNIVWTIVIHPFLQNIVQYQQAIVSFLSFLQSTVLHYIPFSQLFIPLQLPQAIIQFVFRILQSIAQIFNVV